jgi:PBP1b-binding outer membrane lipoprotein LpoB
MQGTIMTRKLLALGMILGLAACGGGEEADVEEMEPTLETEEPAAAPMPADTMMMDSMMMDTMMMDSMDHDTMGGGM